MKITTNANPLQLESYGAVDRAAARRLSAAPPPSTPPAPLSLRWPGLGRGRMRYVAVVRRKQWSRASWGWVRRGHTAGGLRRMRGLFPVEAQCPKIRVTRLSDLKAFSQDFSDFKIYHP